MATIRLHISEANTSKKITGDLALLVFDHQTNGTEMYVSRRADLHVPGNPPDMGEYFRKFGNGNYNIGALFDGLNEKTIKEIYKIPQHQTFPDLIKAIENILSQKEQKTKRQENAQKWEQQDWVPGAADTGDGAYVTPK